MSLFISSLNSGSNGNCYYVGNSTEAVLIDVGISCREVEKRMYRLGLDIHLVKAVFISHEHSDHISGLPVLAKKYRLPVYITEATRRGSRLQLQAAQMRSFIAATAVQVGNLFITPFSKHHDAADPYSFTITCSGVTVGVFTDIGKPCSALVQHFSQCHAAFLEANYDTKMLTEGSYPFHLKNRIRGGQGHLSNDQALALFLQHRPSFMSHLLLAHLSKNNNSPQLVQQLFGAHAGTTHITVASRYNESPVYHITGSDLQNRGVRPPDAAVSQLALFDF